MPLPDPRIAGGLDWPPRALGPATPKLHEWAAWYAGDSDRLSRQYGAFGETNMGPRPRRNQYAGGLVGGLARFFWGAPQTAGQQRTKLHVPIAADIATASSDLLFSEALTLGFPDLEGEAEKAAMERLRFITDGIQLDSLLLEQGELNAALGGVFLRVVWDTKVENRHPLATVVHADSALPTFSYGRLTSVLFWHILATTETQTWRLLESHDRGRIDYGLYEGTAEKLGRLIPLEDPRFPELAGIAADVDDESGVATGTDLLTAVYIPNMKPQRLWRHHPVCSNLGRSDFDQVEPLFDAADETMTSWMRDIRLGKGRIIVPNYMLEDTGIGTARTFNIDREVFTGLALPPSEGGNEGAALSVQQFEIRTQQHADTLRGILSAAFRTAGYSAQTFGLWEEGAPTATEVNSRDRRSFTTREKKSRYYSDGLARFLQVFAAVDAAVFNGGIPPVPVQVDFPAASQPDPEVESRTVQQLRAAQVLSIDSGVRRVNPDWDDTAVAEEVARIHAEQQAAQPAPLDPLGVLPGDEGGGPPAPPFGQ